MLPIRQLISVRRDNYIKGKCNNLHTHTPLSMAYDLAKSVNTKSARVITQILNSNKMTVYASHYNVKHIQQNIPRIFKWIRNLKKVTYMIIISR